MLTRQSLQWSAWQADVCEAGVLTGRQPGPRLARPFVEFLRPGIPLATVALGHAVWILFFPEGQLRPRGFGAPLRAGALARTISAAQNQRPASRRRMADAGVGVGSPRR